MLGWIDPTAMRLAAAEIERSGEALRAAGEVVRTEVAAGAGGPATAALPEATIDLAERLASLAYRLRVLADLADEAELTAFRLAQETQQVAVSFVAPVLFAVATAPSSWLAVPLLGGALVAAGLADDVVRPLLNTPLLANVIRAGVEFTDDAAAGALGLPVPPPVRGDERKLLDVVHDGMVATGLVATGGLVVAARTTGPAAGPITGIASIVAAIPESEDGGPQVVVTRAVRPDGSAVYLATVAGTSNLGFGTSTQPFDQIGNLSSYGRNEGESVTAIETALAAAGVRPGDEVVFAAHSQGGLAAQAIVEQGCYEVPLFVVVGGPVSSTGIPEGTTMLELQHPADPIVALEGMRPPDDDRSTVVVVDPYADGSRPHTAGVFDSHALTLYRETAEWIESHPTGEVATVGVVVDDVFRDAVPVDTQRFTIAREEPRFGDGR